MGRVLHIINGEHYAGAERVQDLLGLYLPDHGWDCLFVCLKTGKFSQRCRARSPLYDERHGMAMRRFYDLRPVLKIAQLIRRESVDIIHTHGVRSLMLGVIVRVLTHRPLVHHVHSPTGRDTESHGRNAINQWVEDVLVKRATRIICVAQSLADDMRSRCPVVERRLWVVPNGVEPVVPSLPWRPPDHDWVLGCVALFRPRKGLDVLLHAIAHLREKGISLSVRIVGEFETEAYKEQMIHMATETLGLSDQIEWIGFCSNVASEMALCQAIIVPSLYGEGMPMVVLEAMAAQRPVIASAVEGVGEVIVDGDTGRLIPPDNPQALAAAIEQLMQSPDTALRFSRAAYQHFMLSFTARSMAERVAHVYKSVRKT